LHNLSGIPNAGSSGKYKYLFVHRYIGKSLNFKLMCGEMQDITTEEICNNKVISKKNFSWRRATSLIK